MDPAPDEIDLSAVARARERAAATYDDGAGLQREVADELLERLAAVRVEPARIVDLGCATGYAARRLQRMYRAAQVIGVELAPAMAARVPGRWRPGRRPAGVCADPRRLPLADQSTDIVFSNLVLDRVPDVRALFAEVRRVLRPEGVLMFSTWGPDTLSELRAAWAEVDDAVHVHTFLDMHDIGDAVLAAGLTDPVMDVDRVRRGYDDVRALMRALKCVGAHNATAGRRRGLTPGGALRRVEAAYPHAGTASGIAATWEIAYGHAWGATTPRPGSGTAQEFHVPIESIGRARANAG
ncbi:MAG: methyltransferase domain-containing protein [Halofilum sp. (in: g-proteobacteria)]|nr:methyltransferase domain-containing protein [Halofilum sp. (in: g-proteobacteria)]